MLDETVVLSLPEPDLVPASASAIGAPVTSVTSVTSVATAYAAHPAHGAAAVVPPAGSVDPTIDLGAVTTTIPVPVVPVDPVPVLAAGPTPTGPQAVDRRGRAIGLAFLGAFLGLVLLAGGIVFAVRGGDQRAALDAAARGGSAGPGAVAGAAGATRVDATGNTLGADVELPAEVPTTEAPADIAPVAPPATIVIAVPPTAPPTTAAPTTTSTTAPPSTTTSTTTPPPPLAFATASVPAKVDCSNPAQPTPYITVSWNAPGAQSVTLAIDGPGAYRTYPGPSGMDTVPFSCPGPHTYRLTANGSGGQAVTKVFTATKKP